ncbi:MAG: hypothetical protein ACXVAI_00615 [Candidatus Limnocylindrales bacterium]
MLHAAEPLVVARLADLLAPATPAVEPARAEAAVAAIVAAEPAAVAGATEAAPDLAALGPLEPAPTASAVPEPALVIEAAPGPALVGPARVDPLAAPAGAAAMAAAAGPPTSIWAPAQPADPAPRRPAPVRAASAPVWLPSVRTGRLLRQPEDRQRRLGRDASAALVAIAVLGLVLIGANMLQLPSGSPGPTGPRLVAGLASPVATPDDPLPSASSSPIPSLITPSPGLTPKPVAVAPASPTPPVTRVIDPTHRPTPAPTPKPTPTPTPTPTPPVAAFIGPATGIVGVPVAFTNQSTPGSSAKWYVDDVLVGSTWDLAYAFEAGDHQVTLVVTRSGKSDDYVGFIRVDPPA